MFKGYNLDLSRIDDQSFLDISQSEIDDYDRKMDVIKSGLKKNIDQMIHLPRTDDNKVDGSQLINDWFPDYKADIFISHSHNDVRTAKRLACWLQKNFNLTTFIDSTVWGNANDLLKDIDNKYSVLKKEKDGHVTYNYNTRNYTTSHVHMMLSTALNDLIYSTECIIFLNTPESLNINESQNQKTSSPWIYSELKTASIIQRIYPREQMILESLQKRAEFQHSAQNKLEVSYDVSKQLAIFDSLNSTKLTNWRDKFKRNSKDGTHPLDLLYLSI